MAGKKNIGRSELRILDFVSRNPESTVRDVSDHFAADGLARTTILTVMERLRKKGFLRRKKIDGLFHYYPKDSRSDFLNKLVRDFIANSLGGQITPFLSYLEGSDAELTEKEIQELRQIVEKKSPASKGR